jgi:uncharacterized protein YjbI with pentapeptide repeats
LCCINLVHLNRNSGCLAQYWNHMNRFTVLEVLEITANTRSLYGSDLRGLDFNNTNLSYAALAWTNLCDTDLRSADLRGADLRGSDMSTANLSETILYEAKYNNATRWPDGFDPEDAGAVLVEY